MKVTQPVGLGMGWVTFSGHQDLFFSAAAIHCKLPIENLLDALLLHFRVCFGLFGMWIRCLVMVEDGVQFYGSSEFRVNVAGSLAPEKPGFR